MPGGEQSEQPEGIIKSEQSVQSRESLWGRLKNYAHERRIEAQKNRFDRQIFRNGTLDFNFDDYVYAARRDLEKRRPWIEQHTMWSEAEKAETIAREMRDVNYNLIWQQRYSGEIPKRWTSWVDIKDDFEKARKQQIALSNTLVDAGISHPHWLVALEVGKGQRLDVRQLTWILVRPDFTDNYGGKQIITAQKEMGVTDEDIQLAEQLADDIRSRMKEEGSEIPSLDHEPRQIPSDTDEK